MTRPRRALIDRLKDGPCVDCGRTYASWLMEFDHVRGVKRANVSDLAQRPESEILAEVAKCDLVCANCHRQRELDRHLDRHVEAALDADLDYDLADD